MNISSALQTGVSQSAAKISKYSPQLLTGVGIIGLIAAGVVAAKQTLKLEETLDTSNARLENVKHHIEEGNATQKDVNKAVVQNTVDLVKLYWVPVTIGVASTTLILVGHSILHKRNVALIGAYATLQDVDNYRARVVEEYGVEADEKFRYGFRDTVEVDEKGKKTTVRTVDSSSSSYLFSLGPENDNWNGRHDLNEFFVTRMLQNIANDKLQARGHLFLNDVLRMLGIEDTRAGAVTGWVYKSGIGDDFISFGIKDLQESQGYILLDFNVDGVILDHI